MRCLTAAGLLLTLALTARAADTFAGSWDTTFGPMTLTQDLAFVGMAGTGLHPFGGIRHCLPLTPVLFLLASAGIVQLFRYTPRGADLVVFLLLFAMAIEA